MPLIKARTRGKQLVRLVTRFDRENHETIHAYAHFICEPVEYVLNQLVDTVLAKDKEFAAWRADHPQSYVTPRKQPRRRLSTRRQDPRGEGRHEGRDLAHASLSHGATSPPSPEVAHAHRA